MGNTLFVISLRQTCLWREGSLPASHHQAPHSSTRNRQPPFSSPSRHNSSSVVYYPPNLHLKQPMPLNFIENNPDFPSLNHHDLPLASLLPLHITKLHHYFITTSHDPPLTPKPLPLLTTSSIHTFTPNLYTQPINCHHHNLL